MWVHTPFNHWKLLQSGRVGFWIWCESDVPAPKLFILVHSSHHQVRQLLNRFAKLFLALLGALNSLNFVWFVLILFAGCTVVGKNFRAPSRKLVWMLAILTKTVSDVIPNRLCSNCMLLLEQLFLLFYFSEPRMLEGLAGCNSVVRVVN